MYRRFSNRSTTCRALLRSRTHPARRSHIRSCIVSVVSRTALVAISSCLALSVASPTGAPADTVTLVGRPPFEHVSIIDFRNGDLVFRGISRETLRKPLSEVSRLAIDTLPELSAAEQAAEAGLWRPAIESYDAALTSARTDWQRLLIRVRRIDAFDHTEDIARAARECIEIAALQPELAARHRPSRAAPSGSPANALALAELTEAASAGTPPVRAALLPLVVELCLIDDRPIPDGVSGPRSSAANEPTATASAPGERGRLPPRLFGDRPARRAAQVEVAIADFSLVLAEAERRVNAGRPASAAALLQRGRPFVHESLAPRWTRALTRAWIESGECAAAADLLLRELEAGRAGEEEAGFRYDVGFAHERMGRSDVAVHWYRQVLAMSAAPADVRAQAREALARIAE